MISIAIIDDDVNQNVFKAIDTFDYYEVNNTIKRCTPHCGHLTHSTICSAIIKNYVSTVNLVNLNIFSPGNPCANINNLALALRWCVSHHISIVHLSIGSVLKSDTNFLLQSFNEVIHSGCYVVASVSNTHTYTIPADFPGAISVVCDPSLKSGQFYILSNQDGKIRFAASSAHSLLKHNGSYFDVKSSNSFATPVITASIASELIFSESNSSNFSISDYLSTLSRNKPSRIF
ncbi:S8 family serine peptidase [Allofournierella sp.]|uniref:S8 family serine peptidase n=1 Tax=Allofournierella sp. TaxID=1940256 RepID=UPI003AB6799D